MSQFLRIQNFTQTGPVFYYNATNGTNPVAFPAVNQGYTSNSFLVTNAGSNTVFVTTGAVGSTVAAAPILNTPGTGMPVLAGQTQVFGKYGTAFDAVTLTGTSIIYISQGEGS